MINSLNFLAYNTPFISIFLMMAAAIITPLLPKNHRIPEKFSCLCIFINIILSGYLIYFLSSSPENISFNFPVGHFPAPWGNELRAGLLEAVLAFIFCIAMLLAVTGNFYDTYKEISDRRRQILSALVNLLTAALLALTYTNDIFTAYVFIEINTIAACAIVVVKETAGTIRAALRYLMMSLYGSGLLLLSICILYGLTGHLLMQHMNLKIIELIKTHEYILPLTVALALVTAGLAVKSALYPFCFWLPDAHANSINTSSAILSGLVLKGHVILLIKIFMRVFSLNVVAALRMDIVILILAIAAIIVGSLHALRQVNIKRLIAWSSVAQMGYIFLGLALNSITGIAAGCLHIIVHAIVKPMLFTSAGALSNLAGHSGLHDLMGTFYANRWAGIGFMAGACSMIGIPACAGFASKFALTSSALQSDFAIPAVIALAVSSVLNALYYIPVVIVILTRNNNLNLNLKSKVAQIKFPLSYQISIWIFIALNFILGLCFVPLLNLITKGVSVFG